MSHDVGITRCVCEHRYARSMAEEGGIELLADALRVHKNDGKTTMALCVATEALAVTDEVCDNFNTAGGLRLLVDALSL